MNQHFELYDEYKAADLDMVFDDFCLKYKRIAQPSGKKFDNLVPRNVTADVVHNLVYNLGAISLDDWYAFRGLYQTPKAFGKPGAPDDVSWMKHDFVKSSLAIGAYYTVPKEHLPALVDAAVEEDGGSGDPPVGPSLDEVDGMCFQVLSFDPSKKVLHYSYDIQDHEVPIVIQPFVLHRSRFDYVSIRGDHTLDVMPEGLPTVVDGVRIATWSSLYKHLHEWATSAPSSIGGCLQLLSPLHVMTRPLALEDSRYPAFRMVGGVAADWLACCA